MPVLLIIDNYFLEGIEALEGVITQMGGKIVVCKPWDVSRIADKLLRSDLVIADVDHPNLKIEDLMSRLDTNLLALVESKEYLYERYPDLKTLNGGVFLSTKPQDLEFSHLVEILLSLRRQEITGLQVLKRA